MSKSENKATRYAIFGFGNIGKALALAKYRQKLFISISILVDGSFTNYALK